MQCVVVRCLGNSSHVKILPQKFNSTTSYKVLNFIYKYSLFLKEEKSKLFLVYLFVLSV
jgi:hypothetical protein